MTKTARTTVPMIEATVDVLVPLSDLYIHRLNTRSEPPPMDIEALADSIAELGLLQNLAGYSDEGGTAENALAVGIVAGGRRLRALQMLAERDGRDPDQVKIRVRVTSDEATAQLWASAENTARQSLHPADEVRAYGRMAKVGADPAAIARAFAVTVRHVQQRLKLASLPDAALQSLRDNKLTLDQAGALTIARTEDALLAELNRVTTSTWAINADSIRNNLRGASVNADDRRLKFIGLDLYIGAGGEATTDLFTDQTRILDTDLLHDLFFAALTDECTATLAEGWKWVKPFGDEHPPFTDMNKLDITRRIPIDLPEADADELEELTTRSETKELSKTDLGRIDALRKRAAGEYRDEDIATSGLWLYVDRHGDLQRTNAMRHPKDAPNHQANDDGGDTTAPAPETRALSASLLTDLHRIRLAALQDRAADQTELMLDLLAYQLAGDLKPWQHALSISHTPQNLVPEKAEGCTLPKRFLANSTALNGKAISPEGFTTFRELGKKHRNEVLALALARLIPDNDIAPALAMKLRPNVRAIWTPSKSSYLARLPVSALDDIWQTLAPDDRSMSHPTFRELKKADKADLLHKLFNDTDWREAFGLSRDENTRIDTWLPPELEWPTVEAENNEDKAA